MTEAPRVAKRAHFACGVGGAFRFLWLGFDRHGVEGRRRRGRRTGRDPAKWGSGVTPCHWREVKVQLSLFLINGSAKRRQRLGETPVALVMPSGGLRRIDINRQCKARGLLFPAIT